MMKKNVQWAAIALTLMAMMTACSSDSNDGTEPEPEPTPATVQEELPTTLKLTRSEQEMVNQSNEFAFNLFAEITDPGCFGIRENQKSIILSPISITYALGMLNNGAAGETQQQINKVLGFGEQGADSINAFCYKMLKTAPAIDPLTKVLISNTIFLNKDYVLKPDFVSKAKAFYEAEPETRDFNDGKTLDVINKWAADHTEQMIQKVLDEQTFNPLAVSYLMNAIYFKGEWAMKFDKAETADEIFHQTHAYDATEKETKIPMMHQRGTFNYTETDDCQVLQLPYGNQSFTMTILLTKDTDKLPCVPTAKQWQEMSQRLYGHNIDVKLPRFETDTDIYLNDYMAKLGMPDAFDTNKANFKNFCEKPTFISMIKQVAKIEVSEEGTEAAAITIIGMYEAALPDDQPSFINFHANRPFLYIISEKTTGAIFFIGQYTGH